MPLLTEAQLRERITRLAAIERPSASTGERRAAEMIAAELRDAGAKVRIEEEEVHGSYWWPLGLATALAALAGATRARPAGLIGLAAALAVADDVRIGPRLLRSLLPRRMTANVVAELGSGDAARTVLLVAHHDAAHTGLVFHPELPRTVARLLPRLHERATKTPPTMWPAFAGPLLAGLGGLLGLRRTRASGAAMSAAYAAAMVDIGRSGVVPGANDNLSGVATVLSVARSLADEPVEGVRVILLSTGSEESFSEGMEAFARRHFPALPQAHTDVLCVDTVGSPQLVLLEGEGMLGIRDYPRELRGRIRQLAESLGIAVREGLSFRNATDGMTALRLGYSTAMIGSIDRYKFPTNYHWPTDVPENLDYGTVADAARLCDAVIRDLGARRAAGAAPG